MKVLHIQHRALKKLFPTRMPEPGQTVRPFTYLVTAQVPEGLLVYQAALCSFVLLEEDEQNYLRSTAFPEEPSETLCFLIENRFLVPADHDDHSFCGNVREGARLVRRLTEDEGYGGFTILTTTACNARCFYCFEKDCVPETMTPETAAAVAEFILKEGRQKGVHLSWFGGEPTVNTRVIDQITEALAAAGREYTSSMISNGYLMDEAMVRKAAEQWKLKQIQITLDGTETVYNERKNYIGVSGSAFRTVLNNIGFLLDAGVRVLIRLNVDTENAEDLCALAGQLKDRFGERKNLSVYSHALFEDNSMPTSYAERLLADGMVARHLENLGWRVSRHLDPFPKTYHCMADSGSGPVIMPDGGLGSCEHISFSRNWGTVFHPEKRSDEENEFWNELYPEQPECGGCSAYPSCIRLKNCHPSPSVCTEALREDACRELTESLLAAWDRIKKGLDEVEEDLPCS